MPLRMVSIKRRFRHGAMALFICCLTMTITGCWESTGLDNLSYVYEIVCGFEKGKYHVWISILNTPVVAETSEKPAPKEADPVWIVESTGDTLMQAILRIYPAGAKRLSWSQLNIIILHESILKDHLQETLNTFTRFREIRYTSWVYSTRTPPGALIRAELGEERNPIYFYLGNPAVQRETRTASSERLNRLMRELSEQEMTAMLPNLELNPPNHVEWIQRRRKFDEIVKTGAAVIGCGMKLAGFLHPNETMGIVWSRPRPLSVPVYLHSPYFTTVRVSKVQMKIQPMRLHQRVFYTIKVSGNFSLSEQTGPITEKKLSEAVNRAVEADIRKTYTAGLKMHADVFNLGARAYFRQRIIWPFTTRARMLKAIQLQPDSLRAVDVKLQLVHTGLRDMDLSEYRPDE